MFSPTPGMMPTTTPISPERTMLNQFAPRSLNLGITRPMWETTSFTSGFERFTRISTRP